MEYVTYGRTELRHVMSEIEDLEEAKRALVRETVIRDVMAQSGEDRQTVTDMIDAMDSMGQEAVLDLTEGEPTTLADALSRYVEMLGDTGEGEETPKALVAEELSALLAYPWPGAEAPAASGPEPAPCPVCRAAGGAHEDGPHREARAAIPAELKRPSNTAARREERASGGPFRS